MMQGNPPYWVRFETTGNHGRGRIEYFEVCGPNGTSIKYYVKGSHPDDEEEAHNYAKQHCDRLNASYNSARTYTIEELMGDAGRRP